MDYFHFADENKLSNGTGGIGGFKEFAQSYMLVSGNEYEHNRKEPGWLL